jgi:hypothetical protein
MLALYSVQQKKGWKANAQYLGNAMQETSESAQQTA